mgnify:CR=1 FL=1
MELEHQTPKYKKKKKKKNDLKFLKYSSNIILKISLRLEYRAPDPILRLKPDPPH